MPDKKFYRLDKDICYNKCWHYAGELLDDTDDMPDADVLAVCAHTEDTDDLWAEARPIQELYKELKSKGLKLSDAKLTFVDLNVCQYGDMKLYTDKDGRCWWDYFPIGD